MQVTYWVISNDLNNYDAIGALKNRKVIDWENSRNNKINVGDIVYIYISKPVQAIAIKAEVIEIDIKKSEALNNDKEYVKIPHYFDENSRFFRLKLLNFTNKEKLSLKNLRKHGLNSNLQGKQKVKGELLDYILKNEM